MVPPLSAAGVPLAPSSSPGRRSRLLPACAVLVLLLVPAATPRWRVWWPRHQQMLRAQDVLISPRISET